MATGTAGSSARNLGMPVIHALVATVNYNTSSISTGVSIGKIPAGSIVTATAVHVATAFNAATTNVVTVGLNGTTANDLIGSASVDESSAGAVLIAPVASTAVGPQTSDKDVYVKYTQTGTAATAGKAYVIVKYLPTQNATSDGLSSS